MMLRKYGQWAGRPEGMSERLKDCIYKVYPGDRWHSYQCTRKRGHGENSLYCKQHAKIIAERNKRSEQ